MTEDKHEPDVTDEAFATRAGDRLRKRADELDAATLSRLNRARQRALDELPGQAGPQRNPNWWIPAGAVAIVVAAVVVQWSGGTREPDWPLSQSPVTAKNAIDFELLMDPDDLEMIEDLEFFAWLPEEELETAG